MDQLDGKPVQYADAQGPTPNILSSGSSSSTSSEPNLEVKPSPTSAGETTTATTRASLSAPRATIFLQEKCYLHRFIRRRDTTGVVERPERLRAVALGLAAALARLEEEYITSSQSAPTFGRVDVPATDGDALTQAMSLLDLSSRTTPPIDAICRIVHSDASSDIVSHPAVRYIHASQGDASIGDGVTNHMTVLRTLAEGSQAKIAAGGSEIPDHLSQGDLYLCPESLQAINGAIGTVCQAVDHVVQSTSAAVSSTTDDEPRAFVAIRPPGHHCGEESPAGFCFVNNVAVGAAHAFLQHGIDRVVILDIDLHHGNGTQKIAWSINERTQAEDQAEGNIKRGMKVFYGSLHDILSYPCEDGKADLIRDASVSIHGPHGQYIENIHLQTYKSDQEFHDTLYVGSYTRLFTKAQDFLRSTDATPDKTLVFISCGFDACEHEYDYMSRHGRKVPTSFYERFTMDTRVFANEVAQGKLVSVLEGGYSDRALASGAMAHLTGLASQSLSWGSRLNWWSESNLAKLEKILKKPKGRKSRVSGPNTDDNDKWLSRTQEIFISLDRSGSGSAPILPQSRHPAPPPRPHMTLRDRKKPVLQDNVDTTSGASSDGAERALPQKKGRVSLDKSPRPAGSSQKAQTQSHQGDPAMDMSRGGNGTAGPKLAHYTDISDEDRPGATLSTADQYGLPAAPAQTGDSSSLPPRQPLRIKIKKPISMSSAAQPEGAAPL